MIGQAVSPCTPAIPCVLREKDYTAENVSPEFQENCLQHSRKNLAAFVVAKGGITSSDVGTKALKVKRARVLGQIRPGIPVWQTGEESRFPGVAYVIFPGNVGTETTLREAVEILMDK